MISQLTPHHPSRARSVLLILVAALAVTTATVVVAPSASAGVKDSRSYKLHAKRSLKVWEAVAACESSHRWSINTHNGYYGGLQFLQATWVGFGGRKYARRADLAMRWQQIVVARRVLAAQGPTAWPVCGKRAHLNRRSGLATSSPLPDVPTSRRAPVRSHPKPRPKPHPTHHPARHKYRHYRVRPGDTMGTIADKFHVAQGRLWLLNRRQVPHSDYIVVGEVLRIPPRRR